MSFQQNLGSTTFRTSLKDLYDVSFQNRDFKTIRDLNILLSKIGDRVAVVDACLPPQLANELRRKGVPAVWVPAMLGDGASDQDIERKLLIAGGGEAGLREKERVLLTRDVRFYKRIQGRAILVRYRPPVVTEEDLNEFDVPNSTRLMLSQRIRLNGGR